MDQKDRFKGETGGKIGSKLEKLSFFQENQGQFFQFCPGMIEDTFLHVLDPNSPSFYIRCSRKCQRIYNFDIFKALFQIYISPPPKFWV